MDRVAGQKNLHYCYCRKCGCTIFRSEAATYSEHSYVLPPTVEQVTGFWSCGMMDFENIGFTHAKDNIKYLTCADCEFEVLGYQDPENTKVLHVSADMLLYDAEVAKALKEKLPGPPIESLIGNMSPGQLKQLQKQQGL